MTTTQFVELWSQLSTMEILWIYWYIFKSSITFIFICCVIIAISVVVITYYVDKQSEKERREKKDE